MSQRTSGVPTFAGLLLGRGIVATDEPAFLGASGKSILLMTVDSEVEREPIKPLLCSNLYPPNKPNTMARVTDSLPTGVSRDSIIKFFYTDYKMILWEIADYSNRKANH